MWRLAGHRGSIAAALLALALGASACASASPSAARAPRRQKTSQPRAHAATTACAAGRVELTSGGLATSAGTTRFTLVLTDRADHPCFLEGYPKITLVGRAQHAPALALQDVEVGGPAQRVELTPQRGAEVVISVAQVPVNGRGTCELTGALQLRLPSGGAALSLPERFEVCGTSIGVFPVTSPGP